MKPRNIGINVKLPTVNTVSDKHDPFFSDLSLRGRVFVGIVVSANSAKTAKVEFTRIYPLHKYERFEKRRTRIQAHNPESINAKKGDKVKIMECRPISKTKNFVIIERLENESIKGKNN